MTQPKHPTPAYDDEGVQRLRAFVEELTGGRITKMERQIRWRPAWFAEIEKDGATTELYLRGDRAGDVAIFPELKREADIMTVLHDHGIPVPRILGYCADPPCIVMDSLAGTRDMADAADDATRVAISQDYMAAVARMHSLPVEPFAEIGMEWPKTREEIALVGLNAYMPLYRRTKGKAEPLLEFAIGWIRRNVPQNRSKACFIQFDSGQFLLKDGKMTGLYDFEFSMIGDPMVDIATMGMRDSVEPLGAPLADLCRHYERVSGDTVDDDVVNFHVLQFAVLGTMQFAGTVAKPVPGDPHSVYLSWDLSLRQLIVMAVCHLAGVKLPELPPLTARTGNNAALIAKLGDTVAAINGVAPIDDEQKRQAKDLIECLMRADSVAAEAVARDLAEVSAYLGQGFSEWDAAEQALEDYILTAGPEEDAKLIRLLGAIEGRRMQVWGPTEVGVAGRNVALLPTR